MDDDAGLSGPEPWFEPKRYGYGAGLPINGKGWAALGGFMAAILLLTLITAVLGDRHSPFALVPGAILVAVTFTFVRLCKRHTRGGWRWRWGDDD